MSPLIATIDPSDDDIFRNNTTTTTTTTTTTATTTGQRALLLAPPSLASHAAALTALLTQYDRSTTDLQMLDRLAAGGLVHLPPARYDLVLILSDAASTLAEPLALLDRAVVAAIAESLKPNGQLRAEKPAQNIEALAPPVLAREAVLAGLVRSGRGSFTKPDYGANDGTVSLKIGLRTKKKTDTDTDTDTDTALAVGSAPLNGPANGAAPAVPAGVGFHLGDDLDDDDIIDEDTLMTEEDLKRPINIPPECQPTTGKRRRACKDCTCGLAERLEAEDAARRAEADKTLSSSSGFHQLKLAADDLAEVDFTVQGKVGSCGNCALGDAFRCDGCPYIGLPPFKPGEEVRLLNNDVQL